MKDKSQNKNSEARLRANQKYRKHNIKLVAFGLNRKTESKLIDHLDKQSNKQGYIKDLIKDDIKKQDDD